MPGGGDDLRDAAAHQAAAADDDDPLNGHDDHRPEHLGDSLADQRSVGDAIRAASGEPSAASSSAICSRSTNFWIFVPDIGHSSTKRT